MTATEVEEAEIEVVEIVVEEAEIIVEAEVTTDEEDKYDLTKKSNSSIK